jgi:ketosteroid isomerase-like protein
MPKGLKVTPKAITAEGDRVALEAESYGELANGKVYNNQYHVLMEIRNGKIQAVREYMDTQHAHAVLV